ncbi:DUF6655 family protein [Schlesneria sp. T3-172]|uniref:DUF6655 family protein n=1 Tax=Schlesneria sphaerica TaxID=3373610 RepID=UPI0037C5FB71
MARHILIFLLAMGPFAMGCSTMKRSDTARTAREQFLISGAVDQSLAKCDFTAFQGSRVFVEEKYLEGIDKGYVVGSIRHRLMLNGAIIAPKAEDADIVVEVRSGGIGTDNSDSYVGIPEIVLPGMMTLPEVRFWQKQKQSALAKIGMVAYDVKSHELLGPGGVTASMSHDTNTFLLGLGPFQSGTARNEIERTTSRRPGQPNQELPSTVAFQGPSGRAAPDRLQLAGEQREEQ